MEEKLSKKELKQLRKLQELERTNLEKKQSMIKWVSIVIASALFLGFFSYLVISSKQKKQTATTNVNQGGWVRGERNSKLTLVEFSDFQCPACRSYEPQLQSLLKDYKGRIKLVYKHFPIVAIHKNSVAAAIAAETAGKQNKFFEMHDLLFEKQEEWAESNSVDKIFEGYAKTLAIDVDKFKKDIKDKTLEDKVNQERGEGVENGVNSTPTFFLNNKIIKNPTSYEEFKKVVEKEL